MANELDNEIGTLEPVKLQPSDCIVRDVKIEPQYRKNSRELVGDKVVFTVSHPDSVELIELSNVQYLKDKAVKNSATWYSKDAEGKIAKNSALAETMRFYKVKKLSDFIGKALHTVLDEKNYLVIKSF